MLPLTNTNGSFKEEDLFNLLVKAIYYCILFALSFVVVNLFCDGGILTL